MKGYETVIGLEVHVELKTKSKIFCSCSTAFGAEPNTQVCPVCLGLPGTLPTLNKKVAEYGVMSGLALNCNVAPLSFHDRKNYFYPDLPKAYQISQFDVPLCSGGYLDIDTETGKKRIGITRIHLEEDAGKLIHKDGSTFVDCNRCGVPLIEIVSEPDMRSAAEAVAYLKKLRAVLLFAGVSDCKMNEGSLRCDVNLSVRKGGEPLGVRCELKNLNSFKFIEKAIEYEQARQIELLEKGGTVICETRRFDERREMTFSMRKKEKQSDYRFFPEPDLAPLSFTKEDIKRIKATLPPLPDERRAFYSENYKISPEDGETLTLTPVVANYFEEAAKCSSFPKTVANFILTEIMGIMPPDASPYNISPENLGALADLLGKNVINSATAKKLIREMWDSDIDPEKAVTERGLAQINDEETILSFVRSAIEKSEKAVGDYKKGKVTAARSIVGKAMGESGGRANPETVAALVEKELSDLISQ